MLLKNGADADFELEEGTWARSTSYPVMGEAMKTISGLSTSELKTEFLRAFIDAGAELNRKSRRGKQGGFGGWGAVSYPFFDMVRAFKQGCGDVGLVELYLDCGVDVNCAEWSWSIYDGEPDTRERMTVLHAAIDTGHVELVQALLAKGANPNASMVFQPEGDHHCYTMSCLQLAMEIKNDPLVQILTNAGAQEEVPDDACQSVGHEECSDEAWEACRRTYRAGGEGKWTEMHAEKPKKKKGKGKKAAGVSKGKKKK